jgi:hypothetical protein
MTKSIKEYLKSPLILRCGCGVFRPQDDYPFVNCGTCGFINCGSREDLDRAKKEGKLMQRVYWEDLTLDEKKRLNEQEKQEIIEEMESDEDFDDW